MHDPAHADWWRCGGTWFVGVDALPNDDQGRVGDGPALSGAAVDFIRHSLMRSQIASHRGQVSICLPGYPKRGSDETEAQHAFRAKRDSAHVDGLHGEGAQKRRYLRELHDFIFGIALDDVDHGAAPFVVWEGSHLIMQAMFKDALRDVPVEKWGEVDFTDRYKAARARVFESCKRVEIPARAGEAYVTHRFALHGVAPWGETALKQRAVVYFRPCNMNAADWLARD
ncbi:hypothetical protein [Aestuariivirga litoralis]|uniref:hypothetical protein n=1 Tax=Aestuariivirga litoralis TaxID=2650924 RepID=UPI0018C687BE|nr:hypothetical protein [Aestuariivirga litoralis]